MHLRSIDIPLPFAAPLHSQLHPIDTIVSFYCYRMHPFSNRLLQQSNKKRDYCSLFCFVICLSLLIFSSQIQPYREPTQLVHQRIHCPTSTCRTVILIGMSPAARQVLHRVLKKIRKIFNLPTGIMAEMKELSTLLPTASMIHRTTITNGFWQAMTLTKGLANAPKNVPGKKTEPTGGKVIVPRNQPARDPIF